MARHVDDLAASALLDHLRRHRLADEQKAFDVDGELLVVAGLGDLKEWRHVEDSGAIEQDVDAAQVLDRTCDHGVDRFFVGHVDDNGDGALADLAGGGLGLRLEDVGHDDLGPLVRIAPGDGLADAASAACDDRNLVLEPHDMKIPYQQV